MREALWSIVDFGFEHLGVDKIEAYTPPQAVRVVELLKRLNFQMDDHVRDGSLYFSMHREDWSREVRRS